MGRFSGWLRGLPGRMLARWRGLRRGTRVFLISTAAVLAIGAGVGGYQAYDYIEHDNTFCVSCHTMADPYRRFAGSEHSKIVCHDCHKASLVERTSMVVIQVARRPQEVRPGTHAKVPNEVCVACHVDGDSTRWRQIQETAGHRVHLLSQDSALRGLQCIACHGGTELHSFASVDQTCARSGCHTNSRIRLGRMGDLSIYCATCHDFLASTSAISMDSLGRALTPQAQQCLSCHQMRQRLGAMEIANDPHRGVCGDCHNPHTQTTAAGAIKSCIDAACHAQAVLDTVRFHRGVPTSGRCSTCHQPHSFKVDGADCLRCHSSIRGEAPTSRHAALEERAASRPTRLAAIPGHGTAAPRPASSGQGDGLGRSTFHGTVVMSQQRQAARSARNDLPRFSHGDHRSERCASCHDSRERHGALLVRTAADCRTCHHVGESRADCATCHRAVRTAVAVVPVAVNRPSRAPLTRSLRFAHATHGTVRCDRCHDATAERAPTRAACAACHDDHHTAPGVNCLSCHQAANALTTHRLADHTTCTSAGCHGTRAANLPDTRATCVVCHQRQVNHQPGRTCSACHQVRAA